MKFSGLAEVNLQAETERMNWLKCLRAGHSKNIWFLNGHTFLEFILVIDRVNNTLVLSQRVGGGSRRSCGTWTWSTCLHRCLALPVEGRELQVWVKWKKFWGDGPFESLRVSFPGLGGGGGDDTGALVSVSCVQWCFQLTGSQRWGILQS